MKRFIAIILFSVVALANTNLQAQSKASMEDFLKNIPPIYTLTSECSKSQKLRIIIHRNPRMHIATASVVFKVGRIDAPISKSGIVDVIANHLISRNLHDRLKEIVIDYGIECTNEYTLIHAKLLPEDVKVFFSAIKSVLTSIDITTDSLELCKKKIIIENKLLTYNKTLADYDNTLALICPNLVFNESALRTITVEDVKKFFDEHFHRGVVLLTVCGDCDWLPSDSEKKELARIFHADDTIECSCPTFDDSIERNICINNRHMQNSVTYLYAISDKYDRKFSRDFIAVLTHEIFRNLQKTNSLIEFFNIKQIIRRSSDIISVTLVPRSDVSLNDLKKYYELFVQKLSSVELSRERLQKIAKEYDTSHKVMLCDLDSTNSYIIKNWLCVGLYMAPPLAGESAPMVNNKIMEFARKNMLKKSSFEVTTRYKADK